MWVEHRRNGDGRAEKNAERREGIQSAKVRSNLTKPTKFVMLGKALAAPTWSMQVNPGKETFGEEDSPGSKLNTCSLFLKKMTHFAFLLKEIDLAVIFTMPSNHESWFRNASNCLPPVAVSRATFAAFESNSSEISMGLSRFPKLECQVQCQVHTGVPHLKTQPPRTLL